MLYHYSGLPRTLKGPRPVTDREIVDNLNSVAVSPGREHLYSNFGSSMLGLIAQRASGEPYYKYMHDHVFVPLDIVNEIWHPARVPGDRLVLTHTGSPGNWVGAVDTRELGAANPAGGLYLSGDDMVKFVKWELGERERGPLRPATRLLSQLPAPRTLRPPGSGSPKQPMIATGMGWDFAPVDATHDVLMKNGRLPKQSDHWTAVVGIEPMTGTGAVLMVSGEGGDKLAEAKALHDGWRSGPR